MAQKTSTICTQKPQINFQETHTVHIKNIDEYVGVNGIDAALDFACKYIVEMNKSGFDFGTEDISIRRGSPAEVKRKMIANKPKVIRKVAAV